MTEALALLLRLAAMGITLSLRADGTPAVKPPELVTPEIVAELKAHRPAVLALLNEPPCRVVLLTDSGDVEAAVGCEQKDQLVSMRTFAAAHPGRKVASEWRDDQWKWHRFVRMEASA